MRVIETKVYQYDELSDKAKERARDWFRQSEDELFSDYVETDDFETICTILGVTLKRHDVPLMNGTKKSKPSIWWSGFCSQGDGACFEGSYSYAKQAHVKIREHAPEDTVLHGIADTLLSVQQAHQYQLSATVEHVGHYSHSHSTTITVYDDRTGDTTDDDTADTVREALRDLMDWYFKYLRAEYEYRMSDECVTESIVANEYEFTEDGKRI